MGEVPEKEVTCIKQVIEEQKQGIDEAIADNFLLFFFVISEIYKYLFCILL